MVEQISRRGFLKMVGAFGAELLLPGNSGIAAYAQEAAFPWTREEVLFGPKAGFEKSREGISLLAWASPTLTQFDLEEAISPWNELGLSLGRDNLFQATANKQEADIKFIPHFETFVKPSPSYTSPFQSCLIYSALNMSTLIAIHELGHALGFVDFVLKTSNINRHINPARCDNPNKPYRGVMAYCNIYQTDFWFRRDDQMLLRLAGLA